MTHLRYYALKAYIKIPYKHVPCYFLKFILTLDCCFRITGKGLTFFSSTVEMKSFLLKMKSKSPKFKKCQIISRNIDQVGNSLMGHIAKRIRWSENYKHQYSFSCVNVHNLVSYRMPTHYCIVQSLACLFPLVLSGDERVNFFGKEIFRFFF